MSKRRVIKAHRQQLDELNAILNAMKNLAFLETRKLAQHLDSLKNMLADIETVVSDFLKFYSQSVTYTRPSLTLWVVIGSERGFCGDFNETLKMTLSNELEQDDTESHIILVGARLHNLFHLEKQTLSALSGTAISEEMPTVLSSVVAELETLQQRYTGSEEIRINVLYHNLYSQRIENLKLWPVETHAASMNTALTQPAIIHLPPEVLYSELTLHYFLIALQDIFTMSLMAENQRRIQHMEGATQHLEKLSQKLMQHYQRIRQEDITEEIELLTVGLI